MSLNGDILVMRNGRSTSQVSVYNYPEHLNPFYEEDQHKRLRFWQINKKNDNGGRRNSFSIGGLKDMWAFKSFRLKKKSSTLGINKTSESPPPLRRDMQYISPHNDGYHTYDRRSRYSAGVNNANCNSFERNVGYRSSLQNVHSSQENPRDIGFARNDQYRRTIQFAGSSSRGLASSPKQSLRTPPPRRYVYGGSVTPQPLRNSEFNRCETKDILTRGSSQTSVMSSNPFDTDNEEDNVDITIQESNINSLTSNKISSRKKRRAPAPPVPIHKEISVGMLTTLTDSSQQNSQKLHIEENFEIANLTAEIESFVKTTNDEAQIIGHNNSNTTSKFNNDTSKTMEFIQQKPHEFTVVLATKEPAVCIKSESTQNNIKLEKVSQTISENNIKPELGHVECIHIHMESPRVAPLENATSRMTSFRHDPENITAKTSFILTSPSTVRRSQQAEAERINITEKLLKNSLNNNGENITKPEIPVKPNFESTPKHLADIHKPRRYKISNELGELEHKIKPAFNGTSGLSLQTLPLAKTEPLKIVESKEYILETNYCNESITEINSPTSINNIRRGPSSRTDEFEELFRVKPSSNMEWKKSTLAPLETNVPPEKRKSVKDIIESINRSQRLLNAAAHKVQPDSLANLNEVTDCVSDGESLKHAVSHTTPLPQRKLSEPNNSFSQNVKSLEDSQREVKQMFQKITVIENSLSTSATAEIIANRNALPDTTSSKTKDQNNDSQKLNNADVFKKCRVDKEVYHYRESSPTTSNLDWNPVPKPKRTKN